MPAYDYTDPSGHSTTVTHRMLYTTAVYCEMCHEPMHRTPQPVMVNWGMVRPSKGGMIPEVQNAVINADRRRDEVDEKWDRYQQAQQ